jgi:hypothetical protein
VLQGESEVSRTRVIYISGGNCVIFRLRRCVADLFSCVEIAAARATKNGSFRAWLVTFIWSKTFHKRESCACRNLLSSREPIALLLLARPCNVSEFGALGPCLSFFSIKNVFMLRQNVGMSQIIVISTFT